MKVLVLNCGSSSIKYQLFDMPARTLLAKQISVMKENDIAMQRIQQMVDLAYEMRDSLLAGDLDAFGRCDADAVVCLTIPARWSGMHDAAELAAGMLAEREGLRRVTVIDTGTAAGGYALVARVAAAMCAHGASLDEVRAELRRACAGVRTYGALSSLTYVARSGRVPSLLAGISNTLRVRPVFRLVGGETGRVALTRTAAGAVQALQRAATEHLNGDPQWLLVYHADAEQDAAALAVGLAAAARIVRSETVPLSPIAGAYTGPGTIGFAAVPVTRS